MVRTILIAIAVAVAVSVLWVGVGRRFTQLADSLWTPRGEVRRIASLSISSGSIRIGEMFLETGADFRPAVADGKAAFTRQGKTFVLGTVAPADGGFDVTPEAGDEATVQVTHSLIGWPTPLDLNFMTGVSPSWKRYRYYRLSWKKRGGETLQASWRYEQWLYSGGWGGDMNSFHRTGLMSVEFSR